MERELQDGFITKWRKYFGQTELPISCFYSDDETWSKEVKPKGKWACLLAELARARKGQTLCHNAKSIGCFGGARYLGYLNRLRPDFEYFLSCGIPGKMEGERYKKSPQVVKELMRDMPDFQARGKYIVFKRWDKLEEEEVPQVITFFAKGDVLAGLFTLANFRTTRRTSVITPFGAGCSTIVQYPFLEAGTQEPQAVLGGFDVSARPYLSDGVLTFSLPLDKLRQMYADMDESFLITASWRKLGLTETKHKG